MSDRALFVVRVMLVTLVGVAAAAVSPLFHGNPLPLVVVAMALLYLVTLRLPHRAGPARADSDQGGPGRAANPGNLAGERGAASARIALAFLLATAAAVGLTVVYARGGQPQLEGLLLLVALGGIGSGLVVWARKLLPSATVSEERGPMGSPVDEEQATATAFERAEEGGKRRGLLGLLVLAAGWLGIAALFPIRSLGPGPGRKLFVTSWRDGVPLVGEDERVVTVDRLRVGEIITVFPEGHHGAADAQAVLIRLAPGQLRPLPGREHWSPEGYVAYSKVCTHAGCPVGLYQVRSHQLFCPCHQSAFAVLEGAMPQFGPATRPLPQLPLRIEHGELVAGGDFSEPVGPGFWSYG